MKLHIKALVSLLFSLILSISTLSAQKTLKPVVFYLQNLPQQRIGSLTDVEIMDSLQRQNFLVIPVDCSSFPRTSPELEERLVTFHKASPTLLATYATATEEADLDNIYYVPEGYMLHYKIPIWNILDHGTDGITAYIMDTWNKEIVQTFGVLPVTSPEQMYDKHGNPIDYNMYMDLVYPSGASDKDLPLVINFASNSPRQKPFNPTGKNEVVYRNMFPFGFLTTGYAWATADHCYNPLARNDVWTYFDRYTLEDWNGLALVTAYVRYIKSHLEQYNLNGKIGVMGISKASYSAVRIANTKNAEGREHFLYGGVENTKPQPWPGVSSTVDVAYAAAGNGTRRVNTYVNEFTVPMITSAGAKDEYNHWDVYPEVVKRFNDLDLNHLAFWMEELGHTYPGLGTDLATGENRYKLFKAFFDNYLKSTSIDPLKVFYVYPKADAPEVDTNGLTRILPHDGILPTAMLGLKPYAPITVRFLSEINPEHFIQHVNVYHINSNAIIDGVWTAKTANTTFEFHPNVGLTKGERYKIVISPNLENVLGQKIATEFVREFLVSKDGEEVVETTNKILTPTDDSYTQVSLNTTPKGAENKLRIRYSQYGDWRFDSYLKFDISQLTHSNIKSAKVKLSSSTILQGDPITLSIYKTGTNWFESTLVSANKPAIVGSALDQVVFTGQDMWSVFDVTNTIKSELQNNQNIVSFVIRAASGNTEYVYYNSKEFENETLHPALVIEEIVESTNIQRHPIEDISVNVINKKLYYEGSGNAQLNIFDVSGKLIVSKQMQNISNIVDLSQLVSGVYIVQVKATTNRKITKIVL